ncbi:hypothetical protein QVD17_35619 [Tagetes erecta]|uniref:Uncharacterized protein n=1 Tax=Tagetes erecta TaxID=13708 RepID=A0AAD8JT54_TARER|nr:hypothetical protein QVD17_35619 [Tagetes erecta]
MWVEFCFLFSIVLFVNKKKRKEKKRKEKKRKEKKRGVMYNRHRQVDRINKRRGEERGRKGSWWPHSFLSFFRSFNNPLIDSERFGY